jgi:Na+-transporting NADH:ubiquinone oxidoreductase subunit F
MISTVLFAVVAFLIVIMGATGALLYAKQKLIAAGDVKLLINGETEVAVAPGSSLLTALSEQKIFLPSACGGGGTCAMCKCQVIEGGGDPLPTEMNHLTRKQAADHWRLACQVKVKNDMTVKVPDEVFGIKKWECEVVSNYNVASFIKEFVVRLPEGENLHFEAGGYIQVDVPAITCEFKTMDITSHPRMG